MFTYRSQGNSLKAYINVIKHRIPPHIKIIAELRMIWSEVVGDAMSKRSQPSKCEYIPKKNAQGQVTGEFSRRLIVNVKDDVTKTAMTAYASTYIENIPNRFKVHSLKFQQMPKPFVSIESEYNSQKPVYNVSEEERKKIVNKVNDLSIPKELEQTIIEYLVVWKHQQNKHQ